MICGKHVFCLGIGLGCLCVVNETLYVFISARMRHWCSGIGLGFLTLLIPDRVVFSFLAACGRTILELMVVVMTVLRILNPCIRSVQALRCLGPVCVFEVEKSMFCLPHRYYKCQDI